MYYANVITTFKTIQPLPYEVLIRVPGQRCPCPQLKAGIEYLLIGKTKVTYTGKQRLTLSLNSFVEKWKNDLAGTINDVKCGVPVRNESSTSDYVSKKGKNTFSCLAIKKWQHPPPLTPLFLFLVSQNIPLNPTTVSPPQKKLLLKTVRLFPCLAIQKWQHPPPLKPTLLVPCVPAQSHSCCPPQK